MALHIGTAISRGIGRTFNVVGVVLAILLFLDTFAIVGATNALVVAWLPLDVQSQAQLGLVFPVSPVAAGAIFALGILLGTVVLLAATRAFTRGPADRGRLRIDLFTHRIGRALLSALVANFIVSLLVTIGFILLLVPGVFLAVSYMFVIFAIGVEDAGPIEAMRRSWGLARGNRWRLFALLFIVAVAVGMLGGFASFLSILNPTLGQLASLAVTSILSTLSYGVLADAFVQVREGSIDAGAV